MNEQKKKGIVIGIIIVLAAIMGILSNSYLIAAMYIGTVLGAIYLLDTKDSYNILYSTLLVSAIFDYTLHVPKIESIYMFHIMLGIFALTSLYKVFKEREIILKIDKKIIAVYIVWFLYMIISISWAINKKLSIKYIAIYIMMFVFIVCMMIYNINKERVNQTIKLLIYLLSIVVIIGSIEVLLGKQLPVKHYIDSFLDSLPEWQINTINARPIVFSFNTNNLDAMLAILMPIFFFAIYKYKNVLLRIWFSLASIISFGLIVITTSRTGYIAFLFGFAIFILYSIINIKKLGIKMMIYPVVIIIGLVLGYNYSTNLMNIKPIEGEKVEYRPSLSGKLQSLSGFVNNEEFSEKSTLNRVAIITDVLNGVVKERNLQGFGVGNVEEYIREQGNSGNVYSPHCYPIEIIGDFGIFGVVLFGVYYLYLLSKNLYKGIKQKDVMSFSIVAGLIAFAPAGFGPSSITYVFAYWILMGLAASNCAINEI